VVSHRYVYMPKAIILRTVVGEDQPRASALLRVVCIGGRREVEYRWPAGRNNGRRFALRPSSLRHSVRVGGRCYRPRRNRILDGRVRWEVARPRPEIKRARVVKEDPMVLVREPPS